ncbi:MAG: hypothetical protein QF886_26445, partial [Planctomycetota bacterium]|nr:hypothetical protein [Planctomycetota bacterium]
MNDQRYQVHRHTLSESVDVVQLCDEVTGIRACVAPARGAELSSMQIKHEDEWIELLYRANDFSVTEGWQGRAPFLWPAVGRSFTDEQISEAEASGEEPEVGRYRSGGREYEIACHGFAMASVWQESQSSCDEEGCEVTCVLESSDATEQFYPFDFTIEVATRLAGGKLAPTISVHNASGGKDLPFSLGNHISLNFPFTSAGKWEDGILRGTASREFGISEISLLSGESFPKDFSEGFSIQDESLWNAVLGGFERHSTMELVQPDALTVRIRQEVDARWDMDDHRYFVLWADPEESYFCPEPWLGCPNSLNTGQGLIRLPAGETFTWNMIIETETDGKI